MKSSQISNETKEEILRTILYKDYLYPIDAWFEPQTINFNFSILKLNCEALFRNAVDLSLIKALICFKLFNVPFIPSCDQTSETIPKYSLEVVKWLFDHKYFTKSLTSPEPKTSMKLFSLSAKRYDNTELLNFLKEKELFAEVNTC